MHPHGAHVRGAKRIDVVYRHRNLIERVFSRTLLDGVRLFGHELLLPLLELGVVQAEVLQALELLVAGLDACERRLDKEAYCSITAGYPTRRQ